MAHRVNWVPTENPLDNLNVFNFKWKELSYGIDYNSLNRNPGMKQIVNHYENHFAISNKANTPPNLVPAAVPDVILLTNIIIKIIKTKHDIKSILILLPLI